MTSTTRDNVPEKLREAIAESEPPSIAKEPYVQNDKFNTNYLTEKKGVGIAMLIGAQQVTESITTILN